jgi:hypothetical protein
MFPIENCASGGTVHRSKSRSLMSESGQNRLSEECPRRVRFTSMNRHRSVYLAYEFGDVLFKYPITGIPALLRACHQWPPRRAAEKGDKVAASHETPSCQGPQPTTRFGSELSCAPQQVRRRMAGMGHSRPRRSMPHDRPCPLHPESGQMGTGLAKSALCQSRHNAVQHISTGLDSISSASSGRLRAGAP